MRMEGRLAALYRLLLLSVVLLLDAAPAESAPPKGPSTVAPVLGTKGLSSPQDSNCECNLRYLKHYAAKGCSPVSAESDCKCPVKYDCPKTFDEDNSTCVENGKVYHDGDKVNTTNNCEVCSCRLDNVQNRVALSCINVECGNIFRPRPKEGCYDTYEEGVCCPTANKCANNQTDANEPVCQYGGKAYKLGQQINPDEDPCLTCLCTKDWSGIDGPGCRKVDCHFERELHQLRAGCLPIYHEKTCCPIEYSCPPDSSNNEEINSTDSTQDGDQCVFGHRRQAVGGLLDIKHPTHCVTCTCNVPPDFTCVHRSCPPPPNNDYENCVADYKPETCCAEYTCPNQTGHTGSLKLPSSNSSLPKATGCPTEKPCAIGCSPVIATSAKAGGCPTHSCKCSSNESSKADANSTQPASSIPSGKCAGPKCDVGIGAKGPSNETSKVEGNSTKPAPSTLGGKCAGPKCDVEIVAKGSTTPVPVTNPEPDTEF